jgi:thiosulfate/3-mercaptopyruvate sulfurtransferase
MRTVPSIVDPAWLAAHLHDRDVRVADVRWRLGKPDAGRRAYAAGHLPGAVFLDLDTQLAAPRGIGPGRHPLPAPETFARALGQAGIGDDTKVIAYDDVGGTYAARLWFLLRYFGHETGAVLDGGIDAWSAAGHALTTAPAAPALPARFTPRPRPELVVDRARVSVLIGQPGALLLDARAAERFRCEVEPVDPRPGHIPGAKNHPTTANLVDGHFAPADVLRQRFAALGADRAIPLVCYCGSGVTACANLLALERAGIAGGLLYEGSYSDWSEDATNPVEVA